MEGRGRFKVPGGKLVSALVWYDNEIRKAHINGDFFIHPDDGLEKIETELIGVSVDIDESELADIIRYVVEKNKLELIGVNSEAIAKVVKEAVTA